MRVRDGPPEEGTLEMRGLKDMGELASAGLEEEHSWQGEQHVQRSCGGEEVSMCGGQSGGNRGWSTWALGRGWVGWRAWIDMLL